MVDGNSWEWPVIFKWLQEKGNVDTHEMYRTFNCGVGMVIAVPADKLEQSIAILTEHGEKAWHIGEIQTAQAGEEQVEITEA